MTELDKLYRNAPALETPSTLDDRLLRAAQSRVPQSVDNVLVESTRKTLWQGLGYAVSTLCVFGIGLGVLLQAGFFPAGGIPEEREIISTIGGPASNTVSNTVKSNQLTQNKSGVAASSMSAEESLQPGSSIAAAADNLAVVDDASVTISTFNEQPRTDAEAERPQLPSVAGNLSASVAERAVNGLVGGDVESAADAVVIADTDTLSARVAESSGAEINSGDSAVVTIPEVASVDIATADAVPNNSLTSDITSARSLQQNRTSAQTQSRQQVSAGLSNRTIEWLRSQSAGSFTIRIAADETSDALLSLGSALSIATELVQISESAWVLLHGNFNDRQDAEQLLPELFSIAYAADSAVDAVDSFIQLEVISYAQLQNLLK